MIRRAILEDPVGVIADFDFFNDYADTMQWLRRLSLEEKKDGAASSSFLPEKNKATIDDAMNMLQGAYTSWIREHRERMRGKK